MLTLPLVNAFRDTLPKARLAIVEGLSTHIVEWIATGRVDLGLVLNPETDQALELQPVVEERLCLVAPADMPVSDLPDGRAVPFAALQNLPLVIPERAHTLRKLVDAQATLAGLRLQVAWEVSGVLSILDLVRHGYGYAVLGASAVQTSGTPEAFHVHPLESPELVSRQYLAWSALKPATPLMRRATTLLSDLVRARS